METNNFKETTNCKETNNFNETDNFKEKNNFNETNNFKETKNTRKPTISRGLELIQFSFQHFIGSQCEIYTGIEQK